MLPIKAHKGHHYIILFVFAVNFITMISERLFITDAITLRCAAQLHFRYCTRVVYLLKKFGH